MRLRMWMARRLLAVALWVTPHGQRAFVSRGRGRPMVTHPKARSPEPMQLRINPRVTLPPPGSRPPVTLPRPSGSHEATP